MTLSFASLQAAPCFLAAFYSVGPGPPEAVLGALGDILGDILPTSPLPDSTEVTCVLYSSCIPYIWDLFLQFTR